MAQRKLKEYMEKCMAMLDELNIPYCKDIKELSVSHAERRWGQTSWRTSVNTGKRSDFKISISYKLINEKYTPTDEGLINTMIHELLHTCPDCHGHGTQWKTYAKMVYDRYGIDIKRCGNDNDKGVTEGEQDIVKKFTYVVQCTSCGNKIGRYRMSKVIECPENFRCKCGGELKRIK